jgi:hypothetical protein
MQIYENYGGGGNVFFWGGMGRCDCKVDLLLMLQKIRNHIGNGRLAEKLESKSGYRKMVEVRFLFGALKLQVKTSSPTRV